MSTPSLSSGRLPSLDGWRALSILMVLGAHNQLVPGFPMAAHRAGDWLFHGNLGVRCFFLISGLLITWLFLCEERHTGRLHLGHFYARRALRILPVYGAFLLVMLALQSWTAYRQPLSEWLGMITFTRNFQNGHEITGHLWSLSVEEQFYLLWPAAFILLGRLPGRRGLLVALALPVLMTPVTRLMGHEHFYPQALAPIFLWSSSLDYFDTIAIGAAAALVLADQAGQARDFLARHHGWLDVAALLAILAPLALEHFKLLDLLTYSLGDTVEALGFAVLVLRSILLSRGALFWVLNLAGIRWLGVLSYSLYIWQQIFWQPPALFGWAPNRWSAFPLWLVLAFAAALVSYYGLEKPLLRLRRHLRDDQAAQRSAAEPAQAGILKPAVGTRPVDARA